MKKSLIILMSLMMFCCAFSACGRTTEDVYSSFPPSSEQPSEEVATYSVTYNFVASDGDIYDWEEYGEKMMKKGVTYSTTATEGEFKVNDLKTGAVTIESGYKYGKEMSFKGWYLDEACTQEVQNGVVIVNADINLYAKVGIESWYGPW